MAFWNDIYQNKMKIVFDAVGFNIFYKNTIIFSSSIAIFLLLEKYVSIELNCKQLLDLRYCWFEQNWATMFYLKYCVLALNGAYLENSFKLNLSSDLIWRRV